jgi:hypothetical protein
MGKVSDFFTSQGIPLAIEQKKQMLSLDRKFEQMEAKVTTLEAENLRLQTQVNPLEREVKRLKEQIQHESAKEHRLDPEEIEILRAIASVDGGLTASQISKRWEVSRVRVEHFFNLLVEKRFIYGARVDDDELVAYVLDNEGKAYLVNNNMV